MQPVAISPRSLDRTEISDDILLDLSATVSCEGATVRRLWSDTVLEFFIILVLGRMNRESELLSRTAHGSETLAKDQDNGCR